MIDLEKADGFQVTSLVEDGNEKTAMVTVTCDQLAEPVTIYAKNDYHYRDFLAAVAKK